MVGNQTDRYVLLFVLLVFGVSQLADLVPERSYGEMCIRDSIWTAGCGTLRFILS